MSKADELKRLLYEILELYPDLDRVICGNMENPTSIIICTEEMARKTAADSGLEFEFEEESLDMDDDDDDSGETYH